MWPKVWKADRGVKYALHMCQVDQIKLWSWQRGVRCNLQAKVWAYETQQAPIRARRSWPCCSLKACAVICQPLAMLPCWQATLMKHRQVLLQQLEGLLQGWPCLSMALVCLCLPGLPLPPLLWPLPLLPAPLALFPRFASLLLRWLSS